MNELIYTHWFCALFLTHAQSHTQADDVINACDVTNSRNLHLNLLISNTPDASLTPHRLSSHPPSSLLLYSTLTFAYQSHIFAEFVCPGKLCWLLFSRANIEARAFVSIAWRLLFESTRFWEGDERWECLLTMNPHTTINNPKSYSEFHIVLPTVLKGLKLYLNPWELDRM